MYFHVSNQLIVNIIINTTPATTGNINVLTTNKVDLHLLNFDVFLGHVHCRLNE
jgi:hypothetical protein